MLPDYPREKSLIEEKIVRKRMRAMRDRSLGFFGEATAIEYFEGRQQLMIREDGSNDASEFQTVEDGWTLNLDEAENLTIQQLLEQVDKIATSLGDQQVKQILKTVDESVERVGNVVKHGKTEEGYLDGFFRSLATIHIDFNPDGTPRLPTILAGTEATQKLGKVGKIIEEDPALQEKYDQIIAKQRERWRVRESNRKLVG